MPDYDLSGLSARSFEQLIQAIAAKVIGPGVAIFGDGPDGGREATFEGRIPFPSTQDPWDGYGVVQAKFRQRPEGTNKDNKWALAELKSELEKFADDKRGLRTPKYYIYATNIALSSVHETGGKDKICALFDDFKDRVPIQDFRIWDYNQIRTYLDDAEEIRRGYAAWITSGDVLSRVIEFLEPEGSDFENILTNFLQKELLADQFANFEQAGHSLDEAIPLARVFVDLPISYMPYQVSGDFGKDKDEVLPGFVDTMILAGGERLDPGSIQSTRSSRHKDDAVSDPPPGRFVLIGGPGQGKTTVGQFLVQLYRVSLLSRRPAVVISPEAKRAIDDFDRQRQLEGIELPAGHRFPIRIELNKFASDLASTSPLSSSSLLSYILQRIRRRTESDISILDLRKWLETYPSLIILDGLDEVPASSNRGHVLDAIRDFWVDASTVGADLLVIATTRPQGYSNDFSPDLYRHIWLSPLSPVRALHYADRLVTARYGTDQDRKDRVWQRLEKCTTEVATARLMRSPLQVTIMATLVDRIGQPPQDRWRLFRQYYDVIYQREMERDIPAAKMLRDYKPDIDAIHQMVGLLLQIRSETSGSTEARLPIEELARVVDIRLSQEEHDGTQLSELRSAILEAATQRLVFLVGLEVGEAGFEIRSLQEFMAAEALMDGSDIEVQDRLRQIAATAHWRNVFLFAAGKCFAERQHLRDTIHTICVELNEPTYDEVGAATLAGSQLALDLLDDGPAQRQPKYYLLLARTALDLNSAPPTKLHLKLSRAYTEPLDLIFRDKLEHSLNGTTSADELGAWALTLCLVNIGVPWTDTLLTSNWPSQKAKGLAIVDAAQEPIQSGKIRDKFVDLIPKVSPRDFIKVGRQCLLNQEPIVEKFCFLQRAYEKYIRGHHKKHRINMNIPGIEERPLEFSVVSILQSERNWLWEFQDLNDFSTNWIPIKQASNFLRDRTAQSLSVALMEISKTCEFEEIEELAYLLPWPFSACLSASRSLDDLAGLAMLAADGYLGEFDDWVEAERRWVSKGFSSSDILHICDSKVPICKDIASIGFPPGQHFRSIYHIPQLDHCAMHLMELLAITESSNCHEEIRTWAVFLLTSISKFSPALSEAVRNNIDVLFVENHFHPYAVDLLWSVDSREFVQRDWIDLLDSVGRRMAIGRVHSSLLASEVDSIGHFLVEQYNADASRHGLLAFLASFATRGMIPNVLPELLVLDNFSGYKSRTAAHIVGLAQGMFGEDKFDVAAAITLELDRGSNGVVEMALRVATLGALSDDFVEGFHLYLLNESPDSSTTMRNEVVLSLNDWRRTRMSGLEDEISWGKLGLPPGLESLV